MISLYCRHRHCSKQGPCPDCRDLIEYAHQQLDKCHFGNKKPTCEKCSVHCYKPDMRARIKKVMRHAGPRMIFVHPLDAVRHLFKNRRS